MNALRSAVCEFWSRDYTGDVALLNEALRKPTAASAGFESAPPSILTGNPFALSPGECVAVIGLNPKWQPTMDISDEIRAARQEHSSGNFSAYEARRARYFAAVSPEYYGRYFTKLGRRIGESIFGEHAPDARELFRTRAFKFDLLPWFSVDTGKIDADRISEDVDPLRAWRRVIEAALSHLRPTMIVLNGCGMRSLTEWLLRTELRSFEYPLKSGSRTVAYFGHLKNGTPILAHAQLNAPGAPVSKESYANMVGAWRAHLAD